MNPIAIFLECAADKKPPILMKVLAGGIPKSAVQTLITKEKYFPPCPELRIDLFTSGIRFMMGGKICRDEG